MPHHCLWAVLTNKTAGIFKWWSAHVTATAIWERHFATKAPPFFLVWAISGFCYPLWGITIRRYVGQARWGVGTAQTSLSNPSIIASPLPLDLQSEHMFSLAARHLSGTPWVFNEHVIHLKLSFIYISLKKKTKRGSGRCKQVYGRQTQEGEILK